MSKKGKKNSKRTVRCTICTEHRWRGNNAGRFKAKDEELAKEHTRQMRAFEHGAKKYHNALKELAQS